MVPSRYNGIIISSGGVYRVLKRNCLNRPSKNAKRTNGFDIKTKKRCKAIISKWMLSFLSSKIIRKKVRRYQYTIIDDAPRIRALKVYKRHVQKNDIDLLYYVIKKSAFRFILPGLRMGANSNRDSTNMSRNSGVDKFILNRFPRTEWKSRTFT
jgi:hypothetical protein